MSRELIFYEHHFIEFYRVQDEKVRGKIQYVFELIKQVEKVPEKFLKHLTGTDGFYEVRIEYQSNIYRIFCCFDEGKLVVLFNGFQKKTQKTPSKEIDKAIKLKNEYFKIKKIKMKNYGNIKTFDQLIDIEHGKIGTESRSIYEKNSQMFIISEMLKGARKEAKITQEQLAEKTGTKKSYISKIENGRGNIQLSTLIRIFEIGLNKRIGLTFL
ncbi:helix-turn-helix domain-containing protein [Pedobacter changchengzhani]|uniref:Helix-turn-helix domain-containing protein n=1 Tax=Pedobacter changchengzhani TaxID=2529274 RepID=A0A4R5MIC4_9SPHI|nr:type II toxin-antitoxin system RelE/ParE family toxin [Pedobacter changchengzhani]TDG35337.1 helix-turn-helix domain-containing protein [Pedobacter changchengzhani]